MQLEQMLDWTDGTESMKLDLINKTKNYNDIVIFGAGIGGMETYNFLKECGYDFKIKAFSDNNEKKIGTLYCGLQVISPQIISEEYQKALILVSSTAFDVISAQLIRQGIEKEDVYYFQPAGISLSNMSDVSFVKEHLEELESVYNMLADDKSKRIYVGMLNYRMSKKQIYLQKLSNDIDLEENQYFDKELLQNYDLGNCFIDAGAYIGDTLDSFIRHFEDWKGDYYCLEASDHIFKRLVNNVEKKRDNNIQIHFLKYAVWNEQGELFFDTRTYGNGGGSRISQKGEKVQCDSLDNLQVTKIKKCISFIKMDIEGAEKNAIEGAKEIIKKYNPILAVCIYHKPEDLYELPLLIKRIMGTHYKFYIRQYRYGQSETVLYAMPENRRIM